MPLTREEFNLIGESKYRDIYSPEVTSAEISKSSYWIKNRVRSMCGLTKKQKTLMKEAIIYRSLAIHDGLEQQEVDLKSYELLKAINKR